MDAFIWDQRFVTGEPGVDDEHRELVRLTNSLSELQSKCAAAETVQETLDQLLTCAALHFANEEALMRNNGCDPRFIDLHTCAHRSFIEQVSQLRALPAGSVGLGNLIDYLTAWLVQHILGMDQSMSRQIAAIRRGIPPEDAYAHESKRQPESDPVTSSMLNAMTALYRIVSEHNDALSELNRNLEARAAERTAALLKSEHERANDARRHMRHYLAQIIDGDPVPTLVIDANHQITHWNKACAAISGLPAEQMVGTRNQWQAFYPEARPIMADLIVDGGSDDAFQAHYPNFFRHSKTVPHAYEAEHFFPNLGTRGRWLLFTAAPIRDAGGKIIGAIETLQDVSERHQAEEQLLRQQDQLEAQVAERTRALEQANRELAREQKELTALLHKVETAQQQLLQSEKMAAIGQLAAGVAHEINNPVGFVNSNLGALKNYTAHLLELVAAYESADPAAIAAARQRADLDFLREDLPTLLDESQDGLNRVTRIVQDLKDFSRVDQAERQLADLNAALNGTLNVVRNELKYKADVILELGEIPLVDCLPAQINQVFMNLLVNAAQAIQGHGKIFVRSGVEHKHVWFEIEDTGIGIAPEIRQRIFDPFFTTKPVGKGTGLGLSISYDIIVKRHHGKMEVDSDIGHGSRFRIWLPLTQPAGIDQNSSASP